MNIIKLFIMGLGMIAVVAYKKARDSLGLLVAIMALCLPLMGCLRILEAVLTEPIPPAKPTPRPVYIEPTATPNNEAYPLNNVRIAVRVDVSGFIPERPDERGLVRDTYPLFTLLKRPPYIGRQKIDFEALEVSLRGTSPELCNIAPCGPVSMRLCARWSANPLHDSLEPDESKHLGEGINFHRGLPIGLASVFDVIVAVDGSRIVVGTSAGAWEAKRGVVAPVFGWFGQGIGREPYGVGWSYSLPGKTHDPEASGIKVRLIYWGP